MAVTPDYFHCITDKRLRSSVYEPEADTFLLLETLDKDANLLRSMKPRRCLEVGCGSGTVITHLQLVLSCVSKDADSPQGELRVSSSAWRPECHAVDMNPIALEATSITWSKTLRRLWGNEFPHLHLYQGDLFAPFEHEEAESRKFDIIIFNPPYVPTSVEEFDAARTGRDFITAAWCGGPRGRLVVDRFVSHLPRFLSACGVCYIIAIMENDIPELMDVIRNVFKDEAEDASVDVTIASERYTGEHLKVIRVWRRKGGAGCGVEQ